MGIALVETSAHPATYVVVPLNTPIMVVYEVKIQIEGYPIERRSVMFHE
uniref:Uncharacterized protein n=1 Tax=Arundo donax TaxID=35708 RepID=A0A0A9F1Z1_ARUDO